MFQLTEQNVRLANFNVRAENHGGEKVPACDIKLSAKVPNSILSEFAPDLLGALYRDATDADQADDLAATGGGTALQKARFPDLAPIKWNHSFAGYTLTIHQGISAKSNLEIESCEVNDISFDCQNGGTVVFGMRLQAAELPADAMGRMCALVQQDIMVSLTPPSEG